MANSNEPSKEPAWIEGLAEPRPGQAGESSNKVRINLPTRPPLSAAADTSANAGKVSPAVPSPEPLQAEPGAKRSPAVQMKKTQPLITMPDISPQSAPVMVARTEPEPITTVDAIPTSLCWVVLGISAVILIIQIWNYFS